ncbi:MAG: hypothetical protein GY903_31495 [Fuerstiella sp.]|nr:hypothetical protein [Fuerstiella sp.]MCP4859018.1 hypothetical protein [Fuerstiella sp.]
MSVAFLPYGQPGGHFCRLASLSFDDVHWPLKDRPEGQSLYDLGPQDHVLVMASSRMLTMRRNDLRCPVSILMAEPPAIQKRLYTAVGLLAGRFRYVLTHNTELLCRLPNARFVAHGGSMLDVAEQPAVEKTKRISLIASHKRDTLGHRLRHRIVSWAAQNAPDLEALGRGYQPLDDKSDGHGPYMASVVIENSREPGYFTEKLIDSFLCRSVPIYWGAPDIAHFFDPRGMVCCATSEEVQQAVQQFTAEDYAARQTFLEKNRVLAMQYLEFFDRAAHCLQGFDGEGSASPHSPPFIQSVRAA